MSLPSNGNCKRLLLISLLATSVHIAMVAQNSLSHTVTESPLVCPTDLPALVSLLTISPSTAIHQRRRRLLTTTSLPPFSENFLPEMDAAEINFNIRNPVVSPNEAVFPGLRYTVHIDVMVNGKTFDGFLLRSTINQDVAYGMFSYVTNNSTPRLPSTVRFCKHPRSIVWSAAYTKMISLTVEWSLTPDVIKPIIGCINITKIAFERLVKRNKSPKKPNYACLLCCRAFVRQDNQWFRKNQLLCNKEANCHRHITSTHGTLQENDFQQHGGTVQNCSEHIVVVQFSSEYQAFLQFQSVNLLFSKIPECSKEYIEVSTFDDHHWTGNKFCGYLDYRKLERLNFVSQTDAIIIRIKLVNGSTFKAVHYVLDRRKGCNDTVTSSRGVITSPNYPAPYFPGLDCYVRISLRDDERVVLRLRQLHLHKHTDGTCGSDYLEVEPTLLIKKSSSSVIGRRFCGDFSQYSQQYVTLFTSGDVTVHLHSDWSNEGRGFVLDYSVSLTCGNDLLRNANGTVFTIQPTDAVDIDLTESNRWQDCFTTIHVPYGYVIELVAHSQSNSNNGAQFKSVGTSIEDDDVALNNETANCADGFVELIERDGTWILCDLTELTNAKHVTKSNTLMVRLARDRLHYLPTWTTIGYTVRSPMNRSQIGCQYGWVAGEEHCYLLVEESTEWESAEVYCRNEGGHLASVFDGQTRVLLDEIVKNSLLQDGEIVVWIGGNDRMSENYFEWADGRPMSYTNWFKGWNQYNNYNVQPSDDGLSNQDCVELRRDFAYPAKGTGTTDSFYWNDRDCSVANPFICQKYKTGVVPKPYPASCNRTITLTLIRPEEMVTSPAFQEHGLYPGNMDCSVTIMASSGYKVEVSFTHFVLEEGGPICQYDYLEIVGNEYSQRYCGDWSDRLKLLRHESRSNKMVLKFVSDFSHSYTGFTAIVRMEKEDRFCDDDWLLRFNDHCYLFVTYPTVSWSTAQQICSEKQANLASVGSPEEESFLEEEIAKRDLYESTSDYWLGGQKVLGEVDSWSWTDNLPFSFTNNIRENGGTIIDWSEDDLNRGELCLALRRQSIGGHLDSRNPRKNNFYWFGNKCGNSAQYICKKKGSVASLYSNVTIRGTGGNLTSPNYPNTYFNNLNYTVNLVGPIKSRIIIKFLYLDVEQQDQCLYDYLAIQNPRSAKEEKLCGLNDDRNIRAEYISDANEVRLVFHTDYADVAGGFSAIWTTVDVSSCPYQLLNKDSGELVSINYPSFYLNDLNCETHIQSLESSSNDNQLQQWIWIVFDAFVVGHGNGGDLLGGSEFCSDDFVELTLGANYNPSENSKYSKLKICGNFTDKMQNLGFLSNGTDMKVTFHSDNKGRFPGFHANYQTLTSPEIYHVVQLNPNTSGSFHGLNHPLIAPSSANYTRKLILPVGYVVHLEVKGLRTQRSGTRIKRLIEFSNSNLKACTKTWSMNVYDPYRRETTTFCRANNESGAGEFLIRSHLNILYLRELLDGFNDNGGYFRMVHTVTRDLDFNNKTFVISGGHLESCEPNPCQNKGICLSTDDNHVCQCEKQYIGMFCQLTLCDRKPCVNGTCSLSSDGYTCSCFRGYMGTNCNIKINPCASNPCGNRGVCVVDKDNFVCKCQIWWQGPQCETKAFKFTYRPLSQRMLEEPFWLGLITVFVVLAVLGCVWCIKRKFADKLEKFITEEIERNKSQSACKANKRHSLRDPGSPSSLSPQSCPRSLLSRIGLRKHSMLSLDSSCSSNYHENRSFSFDDIIKKSDSQRRLATDNKRCQSPAMQLDKKELLHSLVAPAPIGSTKGRRMSLDEFIQMSERRILERNSSTSQENCNADCDSMNEGETSFDSSSSPTHRVRRKRVNFHRTLEKIDSVSFENERDDDLNLAALASVNKSLFLRPDSSDYSDADLSSCSSTAHPAYNDDPDNPVDEEEEEEEEDDQRRLNTITDMSDCSSVELDSSWTTSSEHMDTVLAEVRAEVHDVPDLTPKSAPPPPPQPPPKIAISSPDHAKENCCLASTNLEPVFKPIGGAVTQCCNIPPIKKTLARQETIPFGPETFSNPVRKLYNAESLPVSFKPMTMVVPKVEMITYNVSEQLRLTKPRPPPLEISIGSSQMEKTNLMEFPPAPIITITSNISSCESDTDSPTKSSTSRMHYLSPFDVIRQNGERSTSLSNLSSSGYSSMASPGPSRCNSNSPLFDDNSPGSRPSPTNMYRKYGQHLSPTNMPVRPVSPKHGPKGITVPKTGHLGIVGTVVISEPIQTPMQTTRVRPPLLRTVSVMRKRSDSETTDEQPEAASLPEDSNDDEGIGMDHIDFKIHRGEVTSAKDLEMYMDQGRLDVDGETPSGVASAVGECSGCNTKATTKDVATISPQEHVCPAIVIQTLLQNDIERDRCWKFVRRKSFQRKLSPVSSRSESPMSDRGSATGVNMNSPSPSDKSTIVFTDDSDNVFDNDAGVVVTVASSPTNELKSYQSTRKQMRRRDKSHGKLRSKTMSVDGGSTGQLKEDRNHKRSPKRRLRLQNSLDADASSSDSSSRRDHSPNKDLLLPIVTSTSNADRLSNTYRIKRSPMSRCESLPDPNAEGHQQQQHRQPQQLLLPIKVPNQHLVNGHAQLLHSLSAPAAETGISDDFDVELDRVSRSSSPYLNFPAELIPNNFSRTSPVEHKSSLINIIVDRVVSPTPSSNATAGASKNIDHWDNDSSLRDPDHSPLTDDSGSEVSFYLNKSATQLTEQKSLLSPKRVSPDMSVICYSGVGFGRSYSEEDDLGLV